MRLGSVRRAQVAPGLYLPYQALVSAGVRIRRGQVSLTVAAPGVGKSQLWANLAHRMKVPTLFWSADTDQSDVTIRTLALYSGFTVTEVEDRLNDPDWRDWIFDKLGHQADHIEWVFDTPITGKHLAERLKSFAETRGEYPYLTVVDNLSNAVQSVADEYAEIKEVLQQCQVLAREAHTHVAVLHHAKGEYDWGTKPIPQTGGLQNPYKVPELGLTLCRPADEAPEMSVYVVKNRGGRSDPAARHPIRMPIDFTRATVLGFETKEEDR